MAKDSSITVRVDAEVKRQAEQVVSEYGMNLTTTINVLLKQIIRQNSIPLSLTFAEPDPTVAALSRAKAERKAGYKGSTATEVSKRMREIIDEVADGKR